MTVGLLSFASLAPLLNNSRVTLNVGGQGLLNLAKNFSATTPPNPTNLSSDGYPLNTSGAYSFNPGMPAGYFGTFTWIWDGIGAMQIISSSILVTSGGAAITELGTSSGAVIGNATINTGAALSVPIVFQFGFNIASISQGAANPAGGFYIRINSPTGAIGYLTPIGVFISGANSNTGANNTAGTSWTTIPNDAQSFDLAESTYTNPQATAVGTCIVAATNLSIKYYSSGTFGTGANQMSNLIFCETGQDYTDIQAGLIWKSDIITQFQQLSGRPGGVGSSGDFWLRFMDVVGAQTNWESDFSNRLPATYAYYPTGGYTIYKSGYWVTSFANGGIGGGYTDNYTCSNPSYSVAQGWTGAYQDGEIFQAEFSSRNAGSTPSLTVSGRPTKPIYQGNMLMNQIHVSSAPASAGLQLVFTFSASWLSSYAFTYTTSAGATGTMVLAGTNQITVSGLSGTLAVGQVLRGAQFPILITSIGSTGGGNGTYTVAGTSNLSSTPVTFTVNNDVGNLNNFDDNLCKAMQADNTLTGAVFSFGNAGGNDPISMGYRTPQAGVLSLTYTSGPAIITIGPVIPQLILPTGVSGSTLIYSWLLDGFVYNPGGLTTSWPLEAIVEMCNRVGANCWYNWGITKGPFVTSVTNFLATNLNAGLKLGAEMGNELWNSFASGPFAQYAALGQSLNFTSEGDGSVYSYAGMRVIQYRALSMAAWTTAGRAASDHYILQPSQGSEIGVGSNFDRNQLQGIQLVASTNSVYATYGALNGTGTAIPTGSSGYNMAGYRPVDVTNSIGFAPYWNSPWWDTSASNVNGPIIGTTAGNAPWLQAGLDYANGLTTTAFTSFVNQFNGGTPRTDGLSANGYVFANLTGPYIEYIHGVLFVGEEAQAAQYDSGRYNGLPALGIMHYEGGPQWGPWSYAADNGSTADIGALTGQIINLGWDVSSYTQSGKPSIASGTYNNSTGIVTLTLSTPIPTAYCTTSSSSSAQLYGATFEVDTFTSGTILIGQIVQGASVPANTSIVGYYTGSGGPGKYQISPNATVASETMTTGDNISVSSLIGTGTNLASLNGSFVSISPSGGSTITYQAATGLGTISITGGTVYDITASAIECAALVTNAAIAWKHDASYKNLIKTSYYQDLVNVSGAKRECKGAQYGYQLSPWGLFPTTYQAGNAWQSYNAIQEWNA